MAGGGVVQSGAGYAAHFPRATSEFFTDEDAKVGLYATEQEAQASDGPGRRPTEALQALAARAVARDQ